jgi:integrase
MANTPSTFLRTVRRLRIVGEPAPTPRRRRNADVRPREFLTPAEVEQLARGAKRRGRYGSRDAFAIRFAARHGFRVSELCALTWDALDLAGGWLHVSRRKNGVPSTHPLNGDEIRELRALKRAVGDSRFIFNNERGAPMSPSGFARMLERAGEAAGFAFPVHPHMLRHAAGYRLANEGRNTRDLQLWLGHKNIQHTVRYTELDGNRFRGW